MVITSRENSRAHTVVFVGGVSPVRALVPAPPVTSVLETAPSHDLSRLNFSQWHLALK